MAPVSQGRMSQRTTGFHEDLSRDGGKADSSNRNFGIVIAGALVVFDLLGSWRRHGSPSIWPFVVAAAFAISAFVAPSILGPLNKVWTAFGLLLHRVVSPIALGILFYAAVMPTGLIMRLFGNDPLERKLSRETRETYWRERPAEPGDMTRQF
jgi:hypothetical protein